MSQHVIQRGNNRTSCFLGQNDFALYAEWLKEYAIHHFVAVHAWVFMSNHVHLLLTPSTSAGVSDLMQDLGRRYVRYFNYQHNRTGTLWEGRFKSCIVQSGHYLLNCYRYIELNPVRANLVSTPGEYSWSSYRCNAMGVHTELCTPHEQYLSLGEDSTQRLRAYRALFETPADEKVTKRIRQSINKGQPLGDDEFRDKVETLFTLRETLP